MTDEKKERLELNDLPIEEELSDEEQKQTKGGVPNIGPVAIPDIGPVAEEIQTQADQVQQGLTQQVEDMTNVPAAGPINSDV